MQYKKGEIYGQSEPDGIWVDYKDSCWFFMIKDKVWQKEEVRRTEHSEVTISFIQKGIVDAFLLSIYDCLEPSDIPFSVKDGDAELFSSFKNRNDYSWEIVLIDENNRISAVRDGLFSKDNTLLLKHALRKRRAETFQDEELDQAIAALEQKYEPYELEPFAVFTEKFSI